MHKNLSSVQAIALLNHLKILLIYSDFSFPNHSIFLPKINFLVNS